MNLDTNLELLLILDSKSQRAILELPKVCYRTLNFSRHNYFLTIRYESVE